ncbi:unnamed protein product [Musa hybrid cultivar]
MSSLHGIASEPTELSSSVYAPQRKGKRVSNGACNPVRRSLSEAPMAMRWLARAAMQRLAHQPMVRSFSSMMPAAPSEALPVAGFVVPCGRGDKKTKRGKRFKGSFGNSRGKRKKMIQRIKDRVEVPRSTPWPLPFKLI